jgi:hypothetical protein
MIKAVDKRALIDWDEFVLNMNRASPVDYTESKTDQLKRIKRLEANDEEWFKYYFGKYCTSDFTDFHKRSTRLVMNNPEYYEVKAWSRELSKSGITMMQVLKLVLTGKKCNVIMTSSSYDNAERLLKPYKILLEANDRIIHDYGIQEKYGSWADGEFITRKGVAFRAIGAGQSPRGTRNQEIRPDVLLIDDFDTDEDCRNPDTVDKKWEWYERALYATRSVSQPLLVIFCGNIIAEYCCILKAMERADHCEIINIVDKKGNSTWPTKNTPEMIARIRESLSYAAFMGEYMNTPITQGKVFKELHYKKMRQIREYKFMVAYTDPSYKAGKKNDYKATALIGKWKDEYHVIRMYCAQTTTANMLDWQYEILKYINGQVPVFFQIEWPTIDETLRLELDKANKRHGITLPLRADDRVKPDKFFRIESLLEPLNRNEKLWFNIDMKPSEHMKNTEAQFKALSPTSRAHDDAPDAVEGGVFYINSKTVADTSKIKAMAPRRNPKRF